MEKIHQIVSHPQAERESWTSAQAYILAVFCLVLGVALGYLFRGSASPAAETAAVSAPADASTAQGAPTQPQLAPEQQKAMLDEALAPLLATLKTNPDDVDTIVKVGNLYFDGRQYPDAIKYYQLAAKSQPKNADLLTDLGTSLWYSGDADGAIAEFQKALKYQPNHPGTLFNLGIVRWQGKSDPKGAVQAWEELLQTNPDYPQKQQLEEYIAKAKQHAKS
ncbi:MAG TPA: tetratricopeptide repeat protein [Terriglobales bacterium]|nr:tetratricopeptide repeat protein [Terriglobales bacterium]